MRLRGIITTLLFVLGVFQVSAAVDSSSLLHFDITNGFPSNNVYSLIEDKTGYLWFATDNGVVKFNGYSLKTFNTNNGLPSNDIFMLHEDMRGRVWLHTLAYKYGYIHDDKYTALSYNPREKIFNMHQVSDNGEYLFFCYPQNGLFTLGVVQNDILFFVRLYDPYAQDWSRTKNFISLILMSANCKLWALGTKGEVYMYDLLKPYQKYRQIAKFDSSFSYRSNTGRNRNGASYVTNNGYIALFEYKGNMLFAANMKTGTYKYISLNNSPGEHIYTAYPSDRRGGNWSDNMVITNERIYTLDSNFNLKKQESYLDLINSRAQVSFSLTDHFGDNWYTTNTGGVWRYHPVAQALRKYDTDSVLLFTHHIGTSASGITYWWNKEKSILYTIAPGAGLAVTQYPYNTSIKSITPYNDSFNYTASTHGIYKNNLSEELSATIADGKSRITYYIDNTARSLLNDTTRAVHLGNHYVIRKYSDSELFSNSRMGLNYFTIYKDSLITRQLDQEHYTALFHDTFSRTIWAYNQQKLLIYDPRHNRKLIFNPDQVALLNIHNISNIEEDRFGNIYIGDDEKISVYNRRLRRLTYVYSNFNLSPCSFHISGDHLVLAGKFGIAMAPLAGPFSIGRFKALPNIKYALYNAISDFTVTPQGDIFLNTDKGFYRSTIAELNAEAGYMQSRNPDFMRLVLKHPNERQIRPNDTIAISQSNEQLELDVINYYGEGVPTYKYYVEGYKMEWQQSEGEILTGNLKPGHYYRVCCIISDDMWKSEPLNFWLYMPPYWWQTNKWQLIFLFGSLTFVVLLIVLISLLTRKIVARNNGKKRMLTELELRAIYAQINPNFIFNTLSGALYFINKKRFDDAYVHVSKFSRLLRAYLKSSQDRYVILDEEIQMLRNYIELQQIRFEDKFDYKIEVDNKVPAKNIQIPSLLLQPLVENAINHGIFHMEGQGMLLLRFAQGADNDELICTIEDNGIGRAKAKDINKANAARDVPQGTKLTQQLIDIFREYEHMHIYLKYTDKNESETGTIVTLTIKNVKYVA